jgi:hypothetical protein
MEPAATSWKVLFLGLKIAPFMILPQHLEAQTPACNKAFLNDIFDISLSLLVKDPYLGLPQA